MKRFIMWLYWNTTIPFGRFESYVLGLILGRKPHYCGKTEDKPELNDYRKVEEK